MKKSLLLASIFTLSFGFWNANAQVCFSPSTEFSVGDGPDFIFKADFNKDGKMDLATTNWNGNTISILLGNGTGGFTAGATIGTGVEPFAAVSADFNADGNPDIAVSHYTDNTVSIFLGNGTGGFGVPLTFPGGSAAYGMTSADFNGDGKLDIALANRGSSSLSVFLGNGNGTFGGNTPVAMGFSNIYSIASSDINGDGKIDLVTANYSNNISVILGNGDGTFQTPSNIAVGGSNTYASLEDVNSDTYKDIIVSNTNGNIYVLISNGNGTFQPNTSFNIGGGPNYFNVTADFNLDGNLDIAVSNYSNSNVSVILGNGNGSFSPASNFNVKGGPWSLVTADFNADGRPDIATGNEYDDNVSVLLNNVAPVVAANASATTVCPGTSVVLTGTGAGVALTKVYNIPLSSLTNAGSDCGTGSRYGNNPGFTWMSTESAGTIITSIQIEINAGVDCSGGSHSADVNGNGIGSVNFGGSFCDCSLRDKIVTYYPSANFYNIGASNSFQMFGNTFGFCPNSTWTSGIYAKVTVSYGATYTWSGGVTNGVSFVPASTNTYVVTGTTSTGCSNVASAVITVLPAISNSVNTTVASCVCAGAADVTASGGTAPFSYMWSNGSTTTSVTGLCVGTYTLTTTDSQGCKMVSNPIISAAPSMSFSYSNTDADCVCNGTTSVTVTGGNGGPYTYAWSNGATTSAVTGLCAGTYTLTATDGAGCTNVSTTIIFTNPTMNLPINLATTKTNVACTGTVSCNGSANVTATGGTAPYTYAWSPSGGTTSAATGLCAGNYTISVTDANGCNNKSTVIIGVTPMTLSFVNTTANCSTSCTGTSSASVIGGSGPYTYAWSNGGTTATATGLCGGSTYTLTITSAGGCTKVGTTTVAGNPAMTALFTNTAASCSVSCNGSSVATVSNGVAPYTYAWSPAGGTTATATGLCQGTTYTLNVTDANGCTSAITTILPVNNNPLYININTTDASCTAVCNGAATVYAYNGIGTYTYAWTGGAGSTVSVSGLCGNGTGGVNYSVTVTDALGCTAKDYVSIDINSPMSINYTDYDATCNASCDGYAMINSVSNGTAPYSYLWTGGSTTNSTSNLCVGTYSALVTVTDAVGCKKSQNITIYDGGNGVYIDGFWSTNTFCNNSCSGTATVDLDGSGLAPFIYLWSNGATTSAITGLCQGYYDVTVTDANGCTDNDNVYIGSNSYVSFNMNVTDATCMEKCNGKISVTNINGGAGPYKYVWMPGGATTATITGLCPDKDYTVTVTDVNGCTSRDDNYVDYNYDISVGSYTWDASCNAVCNGKDSAYIYSWSGGTAPYTYLWSNGATTAVATGLCGDYNNGINYSVTVTDSLGCKGYDDADIYTDSPASISLTTTNVNCGGNCNGSASAIASGNSGPYTYTWSTGATTAAISNLCAGSYNLSVKDSKGCVVNSSVNIGTTGSTISASVTKTNPTCNAACNGTATAMGSGGTAPYAYQWLPSGGSAATAAALCAGTYTVIVTDVNGCSSSTLVTLSQPSALIANVTVTNPTSCVEGNGTATANVGGGTAPFTFSWSNGQITQTAVALANGTYSVSVTDASGCTAAGSASVTCTSGINELSAASVFTVYPNPTNGYMTVTALTSNGIQSIEIDNVLGQSVMSINVNSNKQSTQTIDITTQPAGVYMLRVISGGQTYNQKIVKE